MPDTNTTVHNRESWLNQFVAMSLPLIKSRTGLSLEDRKILISCGFPSGGGKVRKTGGFTSGECHHTHGTDRKFFQIFIHPARTDPYDVGATVLHEILHALLAGGVGHRRPFSQAAKKLGLLPDEEHSHTGIAGKPTETQLSKELAEKVKEIIEQIGEYPHEKLEAYGKTQTTRLLKTMCPMCGYVARVTAKWLDEAGAPVCPQDGISFIEAGTEDVGEMPLHAETVSIVYRVKATSKMRKAATVAKIPLTYDPQWMLSMDRRNNQIVWHVVDMGPAFELVTLSNGQTTLKPLFSDQQPHHYKAESREDAIELLENLRDGTITPKELDLKDDDPADDGWFDDSPDEPGDWPEDSDFEAEDQPEHFDYAADDSDPRFQWEKDRGIKAEDINPDDEADKREAWVQS